MAPGQPRESTVHDISFDRWLKTHDDQHQARWCRELYPWDVIAEISFRQEHLGKPQRIERGGLEYEATVNSKRASYKDRREFDFHLATLPSSDSPDWEYRSWDDDFRLVAGSDGRLITLYTKGTDPSKRLLTRFMEGDFAGIEDLRSLPVSTMLARSLVAYSSDEIFGQLNHRSRFSWDSARAQAAAPHPDFNWRPQELVPLHSRGRDLWIMWAFSEKEAHKRALHAGSQCDHLISVYCIPTFTAHHRCHFSHAEVRSLLSFVRVGRQQRGLRFLPHVRVLMNHLRRDEELDVPEASDDLLSDIRKYDGETVEIAPLYLREARAAMEMNVQSTGDAAYFFAAANLLNAALGRRCEASGLIADLPKDVYSFKGRVTEVLENLIRAPTEDVDIHVPIDDQDGLVYVRVLGIQYSFKAIPRTPTLKGFADSDQNEPQDWTGIRLQPVAPLVMDWARQQLSSD